ncbi:hypothetical protein [Streptomyces sp. ALI-76-A]|uniref:hypothetical protein n=1 Tax=Streptomyces sp. ALI-76-A TaxID=3025736 RepID=UPI00256F0A10|nr:hypothetical protein [Streptomyces sp. ALI-76-A]MDL5201471.1 hypothetical protein [Streptomyces sp. ALI-76-A]
MAEQKTEQRPAPDLPQPLRAAASVLSRVPGAKVVSRAAEETLDKVGAVSPRGRRIAVYTGAGVLGVAGIVEWPIALTGAAVAWLTQPRQEEPGTRAAEDTGSDGSGASAGRTPTPKVLARSAAAPAASPARGTATTADDPASPGTDPASPATPSDKLPAHPTSPTEAPAPPPGSGGPSGPAARHDRTSD